MDDLMKLCNEKMDKAVKALDSEYVSIRSGRANPSVLNKVQVDYYGVPTPIARMAAVSVPDARTILISPWDTSTLKEIEKSILASDLGITPNNDGKAIRLNFPPLTEERRKDIVKEVRKYAEECKVAVRSVRRDIIEKFDVPCNYLRTAIKKAIMYLSGDIPKSEIGSRKTLENTVYT